MSCLRINLYSINIEHVCSILEAPTFIGEKGFRFPLVYLYTTYINHIVNRVTKHKQLQLHAMYEM